MSKIFSINKSVSLLVSMLCILSLSNNSYASGWKMIVGHSCASASQMGGFPGRQTPKRFLSALIRKSESNGVKSSGSVQIINSKTGKVGRVKFLLGGIKKADFFFVNNDKTCAAFINYCIHNKYNSIKSCFSSVYNNNGSRETPIATEVGSTLSLNNESQQSIKNIDKELNEVYSRLIKEMPEQFREKLIASEKDWIAYRNSTVAITAWQEAGGTAQLLNQNGEYLSIEKNRLNFLKSLLNQPG